MSLPLRKYGRFFFSPRSKPRLASCSPNLFRLAPIRHQRACKAPGRRRSERRQGRSPRGSFAVTCAPNVTYTNWYIRQPGELTPTPWVRLPFGMEYGLRYAQDVNGDSEAAYGDGETACPVGPLQTSVAFWHLYDRRVITPQRLWESLAATAQLVEHGIAFEDITADAIGDVRNGMGRRIWHTARPTTQIPFTPPVALSRSRRPRDNDSSCE